MAESTAVNDQITDSITQVNTKVLGDAPSIAMGNLFVATGQALSLAALNATNAQQQNNMTAQASTTMGITTLYSINTGTTGVSASDLFKLLVKKSS
ncbi:glycerol-3-phosphate dehydrogenase [Sediminibacterium roseum]|uniref:Glycerol-3-phosphate dehydrogenase n=1 Tax=Sediminibacterium roseum TaxID=1978412 RepID=A0ABW9ZQR6_9BACT|nr:RebB family R body protein [Sediminibacterium roseum]NCI49451.1 glycerol-3-phosphate dehydrogenase [Sediminibacterium roseum]